jgi:hypothetical protein
MRKILVATKKKERGIEKLLEQRKNITILNIIVLRG